MLLFIHKNYKFENLNKLLTYCFNNLQYYFNILIVDLFIVYYNIVIYSIIYL